MRPATAGVDFKDGHDLAWIDVWERAKQHAVDHAEDRGAGADANSQSEYGDQGGSGIFAELTEAVAAIADYRVEPIANPLVANLLFHLFEAAEFEERGTMGFVGGHARLEVFGGKHCEVGLNFLVEIGLDLASGKDI
jgi:hypothetical protein